jgi:pSer/pThr/pTyr-binding forkhead associated (FHA) protein
LDLKITVRCELEGAEKSYELEFSESEITIGSDPSNMVQIPDPQVSDWHARIENRGTDLYLVDLGSSSGTIVDGKNVAPTEEAKLTDSSEIRIADYHLRLSPPGHELNETTSEKTSMVAMDMVKAILGSVTDGEEEPPVFEVLNDAEAGTKLTLSEEREYRIGREKTCDLVLKHWSISRKHALLRRSGSEVSLMDLGSKNGVLLNGTRLEGSRRVSDGDVISVGHTEIRARIAGGLLSITGAPSESGVSGSPRPPESSAPRAESRSETPPRRAAETPRRPEPPRAEAPPPRPPERRLERETSLADYVPIILGILLLLAAVGVAVYLFVLK